jgi:hypothetical protein
MSTYRNGISYSPVYTVLLRRTATGYHCRIERSDGSLAGDAAATEPQDAIAAAWDRVFPDSTQDSEWIDPDDPYRGTAGGEQG